MTTYEAVFFWITIWMYGLGFVSLLSGVVFKKGAPLNAGWSLALSGFASQSISIAIRWLVTGHPPVMRVYENSMLSGWFLTALFIVLRRWNQRVEVIGVVVLPIVLMTLGNGIMSRPIHEPLSPPFQSNWLWFHVFFAWVAYGAFCTAAGLGVAYLLKDRAQKRGSVAEIYLMLPELRVLNEVMLKTVIFGFIALTVEIGAGSLWAYGLWGRYWGWDPIETWSLITWLIYGTVIHLGVTLGWKGKRLAWLVIASLISVFITYGGIGYMSGIHTVIL